MSSHQLKLDLLAITLGTTLALLLFAPVIYVLWNVTRFGSIGQ